MNISIVAGVYGIFFLFTFVSFIKIVFTNSSSLSRFLRMYITLIVSIYVVYSAISFGYFTIDEGTDELQKILLITTYIIFSIIVMAVLVKFDTAKESVRDEGKYRALDFEQFKSKYGKKKKGRMFELIVGTIQSFFLLSVSVLSIIIVILDHSCSIPTILSSILIFMTFILSCWYKSSISKIFKENIRYNMLKKIILTESIRDFDEVTRLEVGRKTLKLYQLLFIDSLFYSKAYQTNDAIVKEIANKCDVPLDEYWEYLSDHYCKCCKP